MEAKSINEKILKTKIFELIVIAIIGILLVVILYKRIGDYVIWIGGFTALIELIVFISNNYLDFLYNELIDGA